MFFESSNVIDWIDINLTGGFVDSCFGSWWLDIFRFLVYDLWIAHTSRSHGNTHLLDDPNAMAMRSLLRIVEFLSVRA